jgi:hypothetical protein
MSYFLRIILLVFVTVRLFGKRGLEDRMIVAVKQTNMVQLQDLMKKFDRDYMSPQEKKEVLKLIQATCHDVLQSSKNAALVSSKQDLLSALGGGLVGVWGASYLVLCKEHLKERSRIDAPWLIVFASGSVLMTLLGGYFCLQGLRKSFQQKRHTVALKIDQYLEYCKREIDFPSKNEFL